MKRLFLLGALLLSACSPQEPPPPEPVEKQGRAETQAIRNTDAVGTGGAAVADKVDGALEKSEDAGKKLEEEAERQTAGE